MSDPQQPDALSLATDRLVKAVQVLLPADRTEAAAVFGAALSDLLAEVIGRATVQSASAVNFLVQRQEQEKVGLANVRTIVEDLDRRVGALERTVGGGQ